MFNNDKLNERPLLAAGPHLPLLRPRECVRGTAPPCASSPAPPSYPRSHPGDASFSCGCQRRPRGCACSCKSLRTWRGFLPGRFGCRYGRASHMKVRVLGEATFLLRAGVLEMLVPLS